MNEFFTGPMEYSNLMRNPLTQVPVHSTISQSPTDVVQKSPTNITFISQSHKRGIERNKKVGRVNQHFASIVTNLSDNERRQLQVHNIADIAEKLVLVNGAADQTDSKRTEFKLKKHSLS